MFVEKGQLLFEGSDLILGMRLLLLRIILSSPGYISGKSDPSGSLGIQVRLGYKAALLRQHHPVVVIFLREAVLAFRRLADCRCRTIGTVETVVLLTGRTDLLLKLLSLNIQRRLGGGIRL